MLLTVDEYMEHWRMTGREVLSIHLTRKMYSLFLLKRMLEAEREGR
jgi:hypothetical protein